MQYLLHSKKFRKNLIKWLFMYCCVLGLFTAIVTYSRYITVLTPKPSEARAAKFDVMVKFDNMCGENSSSESCTYNLRPTDQLDYYFSVDTTKLEVDTNFETYINIHSDFTDYELYDLASDVPYVLGKDYTVEGNKIIIKEFITAESHGYNRHYKLTIRMNDSNIQGKQYDRAVVIGYQATQYDEGSTN